VIAKLIGGAAWVVAGGAARTVAPLATAHVGAVYQTPYRFIPLVVEYAASAAR
jgi:hypothetical protein